MKKAGLFLYGSCDLYTFKQCAPMRADIQIFISCARKDTIKKEMAGLGEAWQSPTEHGGNLSESF